MKEAFRVALCRAPSEDEQQEAVRFLRQCQNALKSERTDDKELRVDVWSSLCQALIASAEFRYY